MVQPLSKELWKHNTPHWWPERYHYGKDGLIWHLYHYSMQTPDQVAIIYYGTKITYRELNRLIWKTAGGLRKLGVKKGDRVYMALRNCPQFVITYFAAAALGAVIIPGSPLFKSGELSFILKDSGAKVLITEDLFYPVYQGITEELPDLQHVVVTSVAEYIPDSPTLPIVFPTGTGGAAIEGVLSWQELISSDPIPELEELDIKNDVAALQYTSGTTGNPKGVMLTHFNVLASATNSAYGREIRSDDVHVVLLPLFNVNGSNNVMNAPFLTGGTLVLMTAFDLPSLFEAIQLYKVTVLMAITTMNIAFINYPKFADYDLSSLRFFGTGGMSLPQALFNKYMEIFGIELQDGYGMSETMAYTIGNSTGYSRVGTIGIPCPLVDISIRDLNDSSQEAAPGAEGELWQRGPSVGMGYWNAPEASEQTFFKTEDSEFYWLKTGDIVRMDEDGFLWVCGRTKEMIKVSGNSVFLAEVDEYLYRHPAVAEVCAIGIPHEHRGEVVKALVVLKPEYQGKVTEEEIIVWAKEQMSDYKAPRAVEFRESLPKSGTGKIMRKILNAEEAAKQ